MTIHRFHKRLARMLRGFGTVAQTLSLTEKCQPDHLRSQLTKAHPAVHMLLWGFLFLYHVWILSLDVLTIKLIVVNLRSYGSDLWSNKNDQWDGQNPAISYKKHWEESFHSRYKQKKGRLYCIAFLFSPFRLFLPIDDFRLCSVEVIQE